MRLHVKGGPVRPEFELYDDTGHRINARIREVEILYNCCSGADGPLPQPLINVRVTFLGVGLIGEVAGLQERPPPETPWSPEDRAAAQRIWDETA